MVHRIPQDRHGEGMSDGRNRLRLALPSEGAATG